MDIGWAILIIGVAALFAALLLLVNGVVYAEMMNSEVPRGLGNRGRLHALHGLHVGIAMAGRVLDRLGLCRQVGFTRWIRSRLLNRVGPVPPGMRVVDRTFSGVPVRIYEPVAPSTRSASSSSSSSSTLSSTASTHRGLGRALVYFHGGGWVMGSIGAARALGGISHMDANRYRLAPEHCYPAQLDDCQGATCHFLLVAEAEFAVDPGRVAVGGDGSGGNLAAALCLRLTTAAAAATAGGEEGAWRGAPPCAQLLLCPALQMADFSTPSYQQNAAVPPLYRGRAAFYFLQYLAGDAALCPDVLDGAHVPPELRRRHRDWLAPSNLPAECLARGRWRPPPAAPEYDAEVYHALRDGLGADVSPLLADGAVLARSPPAFLLTCEYDVLRDDGLLYRRRLLDLGVPVAWRHAADGFHGVHNFVNRGWLSFPAAARALDAAAEFLKTL